MEITISQSANKNNLLQLIWLRLIAILGQVITIISVQYILKISLPLTAMFGVLLILTVVNFVSFYRYKFGKYISDKSLFLELLFDVAALTAQLYLSGGASNPFISLFLLQVIISAILLQGIYVWLVAGITIFSYIWLSFNYRELHEFHHHQNGDLFNLHLQGMLVSYIFAAVLLLIFVTKIIGNLKERDLNINLLKQKLLKEEKVVHMGLLATGAAHELSTPLSTVSVILNDWKKIESVTSQEDLWQDIVTMESQLNRCKAVLSDILIASGSERLEQAKAVSISDCFGKIVVEWQELRNPKNLTYNFHGDSERKIILDHTLIQAFFSIFDNALEESPQWVAIDVNLQKDEIILTVEDQGNGFSSEILEKIGEMNITTKNSNGLGLFLAINSLRKFEGKLRIENMKNKGAKVEIKIPLKNL
jgi:two-component system, sensor histidine kinase RegB